METGYEVRKQETGLRRRHKTSGLKKMVGMDHADATQIGLPVAVCP